MTQALTEARDTAARQLAAEERKKVGQGGTAQGKAGDRWAGRWPPTLYTHSPTALPQCSVQGSGNAGAERAATFKRTVDRCHSRVQELGAYTESLFQGVFAHRFRCAQPGKGEWFDKHTQLHPVPARVLVTRRPSLCQGLL